MLQALGGNASPSQQWAGGFNLQFIGPGPPVVNMNISVEYVEACVLISKSNMNNFVLSVYVGFKFAVSVSAFLILMRCNFRQINNVLATIRGYEEPDRLVILGCHRDSWTMGAGDPISGHSVLMETARTYVLDADRQQRSRYVSLTILPDLGWASC